MRDPMSWAVTVFRAFGIPVKIHFLFFVVTIGLFIRQVSLDGNIIWWGDIFLFTIVVLFGIVLLHEFGHCFGGRYVGGEANEILIWPLGGLAFVDVPQVPRAHLITVAAGPGVNVLICILCTIIMTASGFLPNMNPLYWTAEGNPYLAEIKNYRDGRVYTSEYGVRLYKPGTAEPVRPSAELLEKLFKRQYQDFNEALVKSTEFERAKAPLGIVWLQRIFWMSWVLFLFNLIPAYPLDGGQLLQGFIWARSSYRQGITIAAYVGFGVMILFLLFSIASNEAIVMGLGIFMGFACWSRLKALDVEEGLYGDFSQGYLSLERDDPPVPRPKKANFIRRWLQAGCNEKSKNGNLKMCAWINCLRKSLATARIH
jgi:Zn-dependent protease